MTTVTSIPLMTVRDLLSALAEGQVTAKEICDDALSRIAAETDDVGALSAVLAERARAEAAAVDVRREQGLPVGKLAGVPFVVKDVIDVANAPSEAGLDILSGYMASADAEVVRRLRAADAIVIGMGRTDSGAFGVRTPAVFNPDDRSRIAGGSSGGAAAAVAAGWCSFAVGTDTGGSIRIPAACCGVFGFKPTKGLVPTAGVRPLAASFDHVGPIVRDAGDLGLLMDVMAGASAEAQPAGTLGPRRIGYSEDYRRDADFGVAEAFEDFLTMLTRRGHVVEAIDLPLPDEVIPAHLAVSLTEAAAYYLKSFPDQRPALPAEAADGIEYAESVYGYEFLWALETLQDVARRIGACFASLDFIVLPTLPCPPPGRDMASVTWKNREHSILSALIRNTALFSFSGYPVLTMPLGPRRPKTVPTASVQVAGDRFRDSDVIDFVTGLEAPEPVPDAAPPRFGGVAGSIKPKNAKEE